MPMFCVQSALSASVVVKLRPQQLTTAWFDDVISIRSPPLKFTSQALLTGVIGLLLSVFAPLLECQLTHGSRIMCQKKPVQWCDKSLLALLH